MTPDTVVFDIGGVLIDWQPHLAWADEMGKMEAQVFMERISFDKLNLACDAGATFAMAASQISDPDDAVRLARYVDRYQHTVPNKIAGTWDILRALKDAGTPVHAITNWSAETWPEGCKAHPELLEVFDTTVVSGEVGVIKPSTEIYTLLCHRANVAAERCVFIDDGLHNCVGARAAGMDAIHFTGADALRTVLQGGGSCDAPPVYDISARADQNAGRVPRVRQPAIWTAVIVGQQMGDLVQHPLQDAVQNHQTHKTKYDTYHHA